MAKTVVKMRDVEDALFDGVNSSRELRRELRDFIDDVHDVWKRFAPKPTGVPRKKDATVAERWATYLEVGGMPGHPYSTGEYLASIKKKKLPLRLRLFTKRTLRKGGALVGLVYSDHPLAHIIEYGSGADGPDSRSPWGPQTPTPEFAPMRKTVALMNTGGRVT